MKHYSIVRVGNEYVVQSDASSILRVASRRVAARLIIEASELMDSSEVSDASAQSDRVASIVRDRLEVS